MVDMTKDLWIDYGPLYKGLPREKVVEWAIFPSGRIVVMTREDSYWFEANGRSAKDSFLTNYEE